MISYKASTILYLISSLYCIMPNNTDNRTNTNNNDLENNK